MFDAFNWLNDIPGEWKIGDPCFYCKQTYKDYEGDPDYKTLYEMPNGRRQAILKYYAYVDRYILWLGDKKQCCSKCLSQQCAERGIYAKFLM